MTPEDVKLLRETHDAVTRIDERSRGWQERLVRLEGAVFGDGTAKNPGVQRNVETVMERASFWSKMGWAAVGAVAGPAAAAAAVTAAWLIKNVH
jgi:hypothetical protein